MLLLFDIDGTLVRTAGAGRAALQRALLDVVGIEAALEGIRLDGNTDHQILDEVHRRTGRAVDPAAMAVVYDRYIGHLERELELRSDAYEVLPGVRALLEASVSAGYAVGLATGNIEAGARRKLTPGALNEFFSFGGFGSDAKKRADLVRAAIARSPRRFPLHETVVLGDTERDVEAARAVGARSVGVLAGAGARDRLAAAEPDYLASSLEDRGLYDFLGLD